MDLEMYFFGFRSRLWFINSPNAPHDLNCLPFQKSEKPEQRV